MRNIYTYINIYVTTINKNEDMNLKESKERYVEGFEENMERGKMV